ncbi:MAG: hypothetical protein COA73_02205 [Candidatus Hydrogenedentota bacterium]|nr:MAG: hypothetical protein COA73_02205 [Candidatus Hydrogenedentota bacterium]
MEINGCPAKKVDMKNLSLFVTILLLFVSGTVLADPPSVTIGRFPQEVPVSYTTDDGLPSDDIQSIHVATNGSVYAETDMGWAILELDRWSTTAEPDLTSLGNTQSIKDANQVARRKNGNIVLATQEGLFEMVSGELKTVIVNDGMGRRWGTSDVRGVAVDSNDKLWFATLAGVVCETDDGWKFYTGSEGLPYNDFTTIETGVDGEIWFGTHLGAIRFNDGEWAYRQGRTWLPDDDIRDIAVDADGNAWFATAKGVGCIERRMMTLAEKAAHYERDMDLIRRTPYGYVAESSLAIAGDKTSDLRHHDSDNDGLWTSMYGAAESFAYAATGDLKAKDRAKKAFEALRFLQKVTQGGEHSPPKGYVARTILPTSGHNPNVGRIERDIKKQQEDDSYWKVYEPRWPTSADGKWYWKSDTSSDELDGHFFFYPIYYDLVAETEEEKERVREVVRDLMDHMIKYNYNLVDYDGTITRWGYYGPEYLNHDGYWWYERGLKSLSMLSYLAVAEHVTGDAVYGEHMKILVDQHAYDTNAMHYKIHQGIGSGNQSDDEMAFMSFYNLVNYLPDNEIRKKIMMSFFSAYEIEQPEMNPFFNIAYATFGIGDTFDDPWGSHPIDPKEDWLEDTIATLKGFPLDRYNWASKNSHRLDIVKLPSQNRIDITASARPGRGYRTNGKVIPVENRHFNHWNTDPWRLDYGGNGQGLGNGTVFLLPYYMGLYHGFIKEKE